MGSGGVGDKFGTVLKCLIVAANFIVLAMCIGLITLVSIAFSKVKPNTGMFPDVSILAPLGLALVVPVLALIISFLGCCGAARESKCMLITYCVTVGVLLVLVLAAFIVVIGVKSYSGEIKKNLMESLRDNDDRDEWDAMQTALHCCGVNGPNDWTPRTPDSCLDESLKVKGFYQTGCYDRLFSNLPTLIGVIGGLASFLLISMCSVCGLVRSINRYSGYV